MEHQVCFLYRTGQDMWYVHKTKRVPKHGRISEIKIHITDMGPSPNDYMRPTIEYLICGNWYTENELWDNKENFKAWYNNNFCNTKYIQPIGDTGYWVTSDDEGNLEEVEVKVLGIIDRINNRHSWKHRKFVEIFYFENNKGIVRYIPYEEITITTDINELKGNKYDLFHTYGERYYEDAIYNFINYDGIKF